MRELNSDINAVIRKFGVPNGNVVESLANLIPMLSIILTLVITIGTVLTGLDDQEDPGGNDNGEPPVVAPVIPAENAQMRTDIFNALNDQRNKKGLLGTDLDLEFHASAQRKAIENATAGTMDLMASPDAQIVLLQASQDTTVANAGDFLALWMSDTPNYEALMHPDNKMIGIGVAEAAGKTYAVVQFTRG